MVSFFLIFDNDFTKKNQHNIKKVMKTIYIYSFVYNTTNKILKIKHQLLELKERPVYQKKTSIRTRILHNFHWKLPYRDRVLKHNYKQKILLWLNLITFFTYVLKQKWVTNILENSVQYINQPSELKVRSSKI